MGRVWVKAFNELNLLAKQKLWGRATEATFQGPSESLFDETLRRMQKNTLIVIDKVTAKSSGTAIDIRYAHFCLTLKFQFLFFVLAFSFTSSAKRKKQFCDATNCDS